MGNGMEVPSLSLIYLPHALPTWIGRYIGLRDCEAQSSCGAQIFDAKKSTAHGVCRAAWG